MIPTRSVKRVLSFLILSRGRGIGALDATSGRGLMRGKGRVKSSYFLSPIER